MAQASIVCGRCGGALTLQDAVCPKCKEPVELPGAPKGAQVCPACGHRNPPGADFCQSCGVQLRSAAPSKAPRAQGSRKAGPAPQSGARARDPWPLVALIAILALVGVVIYTQWGSGPTARPAPAATGIPQGMPAGMPLQQVTPQQLMELRNAVAATPGDTKALLRLANGLQDAGQFREAVERYGAYLTAVPGDPDARVDLGICYYQLGLADSTNGAGLFVKAIQEMRTALRNRPSHQPAAFNLGIVFLQSGDLDSSNAWFGRTVAIDKSSDLGVRAQRILDQHTMSK